MATGWSQIRADAGWNDATNVATLQKTFVELAKEHARPVNLVPISIQRDGMRADLMIADDAFAIGAPGDDVRINVSAAAAQEIADALGYVLPTPTILDAAAAQASVPVDFFGSELPGRRYDGTTGLDLQRPIALTLGAMEEESDRLGQFIVPTKLPTTIGKSWVVSDRLMNPDALPLGKQTGINYGGHTRLKHAGSAAHDQGVAPGWRVAQGPGAAHSVHHTDYSQRLQLVGPMAYVHGGPFGERGRMISLAELSEHPVGARLLRPSGKQMPMRHPWYPSPDDGPGPGPGGGGGGGGGATPPIIAKNSKAPLFAAFATLTFLAMVARWADLP